MTGGDAMAIARRALNWTRVDRQRREHLAIVRAAELVVLQWGNKAGALYRIKGEKRKAVEAAEEARRVHRKLAARAAGFRRGLESECDRVLAKGLDT